MDYFIGISVDIFYNYLTRFLEQLDGAEQKRGNDTSGIISAIKFVANTGEDHVNAVKFQNSQRREIPEFLAQHSADQSQSCLLTRRIS